MLKTDENSLVKFGKTINSWSTLTLCTINLAMFYLYTFLRRQYQLAVLEWLLEV